MTVSGARRATHDPLRICPSTWNQLIELAASKDQIVEVTEIVPECVESRREFKPDAAAVFTGGPTIIPFRSRS